METPVALFIFNRPKSLEQVFAQVAKAKPKKLLVVADGPRQDVPEDTAKCRESLAVIDRVDWDCDLVTNVSDRNLGCGRRQQTGLDWIFENVDRAIILEDDTVPSSDFFRFCEELLTHFADDERIMHINGRSLPTYEDGHNSYHFTKQISCWGWATWARAWKYFDYEMKAWPTLRDTGWLKDIFPDDKIVQYNKDMFELIYKQGDKADQKDTRWRLAVYSQNGLAIRPNVNLVENIGYADATHPNYMKELDYLDHETQTMTFPLKHPERVVRNRDADEHYWHETWHKQVVPERRRQRSRQLARLARRSLKRISRT